MSGKNAPKPLEDLDARLRRLKAEAESRRPKASPSQGGMGRALEMSGHLVAGLLVGGGIGYLLDDWLGTRPWLLVVFFFLGSAAGMLNVYRTASGMGMAIGYRPASDQRGQGTSPDAARPRGDKSETQDEG